MADSKKKGQSEDTSGSLDSLIESVEQKLEMLEKKRDEIDEQIEIKRAQISELHNTIEKVRNIQDQLHPS